MIATSNRLGIAGADGASGEEPVEPVGEQALTKRVSAIADTKNRWRRMFHSSPTALANYSYKERPSGKLPDSRLAVLERARFFLEGRVRHHNYLSPTHP
jgi:hypothetical protein